MIDTGPVLYSDRTSEAAAYRPKLRAEDPRDRLPASVRASVWFHVLRNLVSHSDYLKAMVLAYEYNDGLGRGAGASGGEGDEREFLF